MKGGLKGGGGAGEVEIAGGEGTCEWGGGGGVEIVGGEGRCEGGGSKDSGR